MRLSPTWVRLSLPSSTREHIYEALAAYLDNKLRLLDALALLRRHTSKGLWARETFLDLIQERLAHGRPLGAAMSDMIPDAENMIIAGGEAAGRQAQALRLAADMVRARREVLASVWEALGYPLFLVLLFAGLLLTVALFVVPSLVKVIPLDKWQGSALTLHAASAFVASWQCVTLAVVLAVLVALAVYSLPRWTGGSRRIVDHLPPWSLYRMVVSSMWLFTMATLIQGGVRTARALELTRDSGRSPWLKEKIQSIMGSYARGRELGQALAASGSFLDQELLDELSVYAALPDFSAKLHGLTRNWLDTRMKQVRRACRRINSASIFAILLLLAGIGLAVVDLATVLSQGITFL